MDATENDQNQLVTISVTSNHANLSLPWQILLGSAECITKAYLFLKKKPKKPPTKEQILFNTEFQYTVKLCQSK